MSGFSSDYYLVFAEGLKTKFIRKLSAGEHGLYLQHMAVINRFNKDHELLRLVIKAYRDYESFMKQCVEKVRMHAELNQESLVDYSFEPAALVLNYLNAVRIFVDHFKMKISRSFGKSSEQLGEYQQLLKTEFDEYFSYRLLYRLRNYTTHCGLPLFHFEIKRVPGEHASIITLMKPKELLESFDEWGPDVTKDLSGMDSDIYVWPLLGENADSISYIYQTLYAHHYRDECLESRDWLCKFLGEDLPSTGFAIVEGDPDDERKQETLMHFLPVQNLIRLIKTEEEFVADNPFFQ
ncbi:hypothetical protein [Pseudomonas simiae]|uniref:hypothetical protein n=1 Tax=Pseudomonas simiae TaxID=321846 RepID=UPI002734E8D7|nr:hypothetical protein [Pseudomonas simiae]WLH99837.1 hypothetical protein PSH95_20820 [Pseudomonas simiae]